MLPYEIIIEITKFTPLYLNKGIFFSNKYFFKIYKNKFLKNIIFIQKIYKKYRLSDKFFNLLRYVNYNEFCKWQRISDRNNKIRIYRFILVKTNLTNLNNYPEMILNKSCIMHSSRQLILKDWIKNNIPTESRTRRDVLNFFIENRITLKEISIAGF